jgi:hypothetical protein
MRSLKPATLRPAAPSRNRRRRRTQGWVKTLIERLLKTEAIEQANPACVIGGLGVGVILTRALVKIHADERTWFAHVVLPPRRIAPACAEPPST